jgi:hypothetical protein
MSTLEADEQRDCAERWLVDHSDNRQQAVR